MGVKVTLTEAHRGNTITGEKGVSILPSSCPKISHYRSWQSNPGAPRIDNERINFFENRTLPGGLFQFDYLSPP